MEELSSYASLVRHYKQRQARLAGKTKNLSGRHDRAVEVALAGTLFLLWPRELPMLRV